MGTKIQKGLEKHFGNLVTGNTITQDQANKIKSIIHRSEAAKKVDFENSKIMNDYKYKTYLDSNSSNYTNSLRILVAKGNITQKGDY
ncbi:hypothetical protein [Clostridium estertheticum]|uniref:hypothetical protein n=1 Tax=Clostridium estertheticum TaxID=238834 RepID=UPI001C0CD134|nr:hypothetical protein [Clostridium estertheticum]MBU3076216.1 hypothetical protein [Clostridium estertheticum]MBU3163943.1 hypothetical protein [Clostridium estertheticum]